jgi:hypothetical protein
MSLRSLFPALASSLVLTAACVSEPASSETRSETEGAEAPTDESGSPGDGDGDGDGDCPSGTPAELAACVERERYLADLEFIAAPREPGSDHWQAVQDLCFERFAEYGFEVDTHAYPTGVNVVGRKPGTTAPHEQIVVAAHYDHIPGCNGADDNATGTAAVLEAARVLSKRDYPRTLIVACWDQEEWGLIGAKAYANAAAITNQQILFNYNYEMIGFSDPSPGAQTVPAGLDLLFPEQYATLVEWNFRGDWIALIVDAAGLPHAQRMAAHADALGLAYLVLDIPPGLENSPLLADLQRSDHAAFWAEGYPAMMITDTSEFRYSQYHCGSGEDAVELLDHEFARQVIAASVGGAAESLGL